MAFMFFSIGSLQSAWADFRSPSLCPFRKCCIRRAFFFLQRFIATSDQQWFVASDRIAIVAGDLSLEEILFRATRTSDLHFFCFCTGSTRATARAQGKQWFTVVLCALFTHCVDVCCLCLLFSIAHMNACKRNTMQLKVKKLKNAVSILTLLGTCH